MLLQAIGFLAVLMAPSGAPPPPLEHLAIHITDRVPVPPANLQKAIQQAQRILLRAGIETSWSVSHPGTYEPRFLSPSEIPLTMVADPPYWLKEHFYGSTMRNKNRGFTIAIFYDQSIGRWNAGGDRSVLLGMTMTHEIGHFFGLDHALYGIMLRDFGLEEIQQAAAGNLGFADGQARALRNAVARWPKKVGR